MSRVPCYLFIFYFLLRVWLEYYNCYWKKIYKLTWQFIINKIFYQLWIITLICKKKYNKIVIPLSIFLFLLANLVLFYPKFLSWGSTLLSYSLSEFQIGLKIFEQIGPKLWTDKNVLECPWFHIPFLPNSLKFEQKF